jgi:hypothetical protein
VSIFFGKTVNHLKSSNYVDADGVPSLSLRVDVMDFVHCQLHVFNLSVAGETFPSLWKQAIFKKT